MNEMKTLLWPDTDAAWVILGVMVFLLVSGWAAGCVARWRHPRVQVPPRCGTLAEIEAALMSGFDAYAEAIAGVVIVVGLLGTFVGLAQAIAVAGKALGASAAAVAATEGSDGKLGGLVHVLEGMGVKFRSSIYGIALSLLARLTMYPLATAHRRATALRVLAGRPSLEEEHIEAMRKLDQIAKAVNDRGEQLGQTLVWQIDPIRGLVVDRMKTVADQEAKRASEVDKRWDAALEQISGLLGKQRDALCEIDKKAAVRQGLLFDLKAHAVEAKQARNAAADARKQQLDRFDKILGAELDALAVTQSVSDRIGQLASTASALGASAKEVSAAASQMTAAAGGVSTSAASLRQGVDEMRKATHDMATQGNEQVRKGQEALGKAAQRLDDAIKGSMDGFRTAVQGSLAGIGSQMAAVTGNIEGSVAKSSEVIGAGIDQLAGSTERLNTQLSTSLAELNGQLEAALKNVNTELAKLNKYMGRLDAQLGEMRGLNADQADTIANITRTVESLGASSTRAMRDAGDMTGAVTRSGEATNERLAAIERALGALAVSLAEARQGLRDDAACTRDEATAAWRDFTGSIGEARTLLERLVELQEQKLGRAASIGEARALLERLVELQEQQLGRPSSFDHERWAGPLAALEDLGLVGREIRATLPALRARLAPPPGPVDAFDDDAASEPAAEAE